jgi:hypothetical protein
LIFKSIQARGSTAGGARSAEGRGLSRKNFHRHSNRRRCSLLHRFYEELRTAGIDVLDLMPLFIRNRDDERGSVFARPIAIGRVSMHAGRTSTPENIRGKLTFTATNRVFRVKESQITMVTLLPPNSRPVSKKLPFAP